MFLTASQQGHTRSRRSSSVSYSPGGDDDSLEPRYELEADDLMEEDAILNKAEIPATTNDRASASCVDGLYQPRLPQVLDGDNQITQLSAWMGTLGQQKYQPNSTIDNSTIAAVTAPLNQSTSALSSAESLETASESAILTLTSSSSAEGGSFAIQGMSLATYSATGYDGSQVGNYEASAKQAGANFISLSNVGYVDLSTNEFGDAYSGSLDQTASLSSISQAALSAEAEGLQVMLKPQIVTTDPSYSQYTSGPWINLVDPNLTISDPSEFFSNYERYILQYAQIAQADHVAVLSIGNEMVAATKPEYTPYWDQLIAAVKKVYSGELTYSALLPLQTDSTTNEVEQIGFWDKLDFAGFDVYPSLSQGGADPSVASLNAAWTGESVYGTTQDYEAFVASMAKLVGEPVVFTETGLPSFAGASDRQTSSDGDIGTAGVSPDQTEQANWWESFFDTWGVNTPSWLEGVFVYNNDPGQLGSYELTNYNLIGKSAEAVVAAWYGGKTTIQPLSSTFVGSQANDELYLYGPHASTSVVAGESQAATLDTVISINVTAAVIDGASPGFDVYVNGTEYGAFSISPEASGYVTSQGIKYTVDQLFTVDVPGLVTINDLKVAYVGPDDPTHEFDTFFNSVSVDGISLTSDTYNPNPEYGGVQAQVLPDADGDGGTSSQWGGGFSDFDAAPWNDDLTTRKAGTALDPYSVNGEGGTDTLHVLGTFGDYALTAEASGSYLLSESEGLGQNAQLSDIRYLAFQDGSQIAVADGIPTQQVISGASSLIKITDQETICPFSHVVVADPNLNGVETVTISTIANGSATTVTGMLSGAGLVDEQPGVYILSGSPASINASIEGLAFVPTNSSGVVGPPCTTTLSVYVTDGVLSSLPLSTALAISSPVISSVDDDLVVTAGGVLQGALVASTVQVESGGVASDTTVCLGGDVAISAGGMAIGTVVLDGGQLFALNCVASGMVLQGGEAVGTVVSSGGVLSADSAAQLGGATVDAGVVSGGVVATGDQLTVTSGGRASGVTVDGLMRVASGGQTEGVVLASGGSAHVSGQASNTSVGSGAIELVVSGGTDASAVIASGGAQRVSGSATSADVLSGGLQLIYGGGAAAGDLIASGGEAEVLSGGAATSATLSGLLKVEAGGTMAAASIVFSGSASMAGHASGTVVAFGGVDQVSTGGVESGVTLSLGGLVRVYGSVVSAAVDGGGDLIVYSGGMASSATISAGGLAVARASGSFGSVDDLGTFSGGLVKGDLQVEVGGLASGAVVASQEVVYGVDSGAQVLSSGQETVYGSGVREVISASGSLTLEGGGSLLSTTVLPGGSLTIYGGDVTTAVIGAGGSATMDGGVLSAVFLAGSLALDDGTVDGETISSGALQTMIGGSLSGVTVLSGGVNTLLDGSAQAQTVESGGVLSLGGSAELTGLALLGGSATVFGLVEGTTISAGVETISAGGVQSGITLRGGKVVVRSGGALDGAVVSSGAVASVYAGASAGGLVLRGGSAYITTAVSGTKVSAGGLERVVSGGSETGASVASGGQLVVSAGASVSAVEIVGELKAYGSAATVVVESGGLADFSGVASGVQVYSGAFVYAEAGGDVLNAVVASGGGLDVRSAGSAAAVVVSSGGLAVVSGDGSATGVRVAAGGQLKVLAGGSSTSARIAGTLDVAGDGLGDVVSSGGVESVTTGIETAADVLSGGRIVVGVAGGAEASVLGSMTVYGVAQAAIGSGGQEMIMSGGLDEGTQVKAGGRLVVASGAEALDDVVSSGGALVVSSGGVVLASLVKGGSIIDNGELALISTTLYSGQLSAAGELAYVSTLVVSGAEAAFSGSVVVDGGSVDLAVLGALSGASFLFGPLNGVSPPSDEAVNELVIGTYDLPTVSGGFQSPLSHFATTGDEIDLQGLAYVSGATATVSGHVLTLKDGKTTTTFDVEGQTASAYGVTSDGAGGVLLTVPQGASAASLIEAAAVFTTASQAAAFASLVSAAQAEHAGVLVAGETPLRAASTHRG